MALQYLAQAFGAVLTPMNMGVLLLSTFAGLIMGMLPGLSATMAVALLTGLTYRLSSTSAIISLIGVYVGAISGGCQAAVLLNIPGTPASAATALDGFPLANRGKGGLAIFLATTASCIGTLISVICVLTLTPLLTKVSLQFVSWEFFLLSLFGVIIFTSGCFQVQLFNHELKYHEHDQDFHKADDNVHGPHGPPRACREVQHQEVQDAVGGADADPHNVGNHLEESVQDGVHKPSTGAAKMKVNSSGSVMPAMTAVRVDGISCAFKLAFFTFLAVT